MKTILILIICTLLAPVLHAAEPPASFVWQGRTIVVTQLEKVDDTRARLPDGTSVPISAVPPLLRSAVAPVPPPGRLISFRVYQITADGMIIYAREGEVWARHLDPVFLRGHPATEGVQPDSLVTCYAETDGKYTYTTVRGGTLTVDAWKWTGWPKPRPPSPAVLPGSRITGSALDRK